MTDDYLQTMANVTDLTEKEQTKLGKSDHKPMTDDHNLFIQHVLKLIEDRVIDPIKPTSLLNPSAFAALSAYWQAKADLASVNMAHLIQRIVEFYKSRHTPNEAIELQTMIDHLWQMKERFEEHQNVFVL